MSITIIGGDNAYSASVNTNKSLKVETSPLAIGKVGGYYTVAGQTSSACAASLSAGSTLMAMRMSPASSRKAYIERIRVLISGITVGTSALVPGTLNFSRFNVNTPTGGTARGVNRMNEFRGTPTDMFDIRDSNAALTISTTPAVLFGGIVASSTLPLFIGVGPMWYEWIVEPPAPIQLSAGDGLAMRVGVAMPGTQTWGYSYTVHWYEKLNR